ncbi:hypothetical protein [Luethyella okanaganae]|uniref:Uncharacterized protein n=1 Tax=Luethyella okanaganae TaxID=69372 RepID=A0ABW1VHZ4_9MICO
MRLNAIRRVALPGMRAFRASFVSVLIMSAVIVGLLAMHASGAEHVANTVATVVGQSAHTAHRAAAAESTAGHVAVVSTTIAASTASAISEWSDECLHGALGCMVMAMTCAMFVVLAIATLLAGRPAPRKRLLDAGTRVAVIVQDVSSRFHRPDLTVLSISRT